MIKQFISQGLALVMFILLINACRHELPLPVPVTGGGNPLPTSNCSPDSVYFASQVFPLIASHCTMSGCHDNISHADGVSLTSYTRIMQYVRPGDAANSKLYKVIVRTDGDRMPPPPMAPLTSAQISLIQRWISQGAKNNSCAGACDSTVFTFSGAVKPMMDSKCTGCHNPANLGGNIDLSTYNAVKLVAQNGKLYGSIAQQPGYSPMPKNGNKLSDCEIRQVQRWIAAGMLNN